MSTTTDHQRHLGVLAGGLTHERDISLRSGSRLTDALRLQGNDVTLLEADSELLPWLIANRPDAVAIALHGGQGENGDVQTILDLAEVPYLGTSARFCRLAFDKTIAKSILHEAGYCTPNWITLGQETFRDLGAKAILTAILEHLHLPLVIKPNRGGSALGVSLARTPEELPSALVCAFAYCDSVLVEQYVTGTELAITVVELDDDGAVALPAVEIRPPGDLFDYEARYTAGTTLYYAPPTIDQQTVESAASLAVAAHRLLHMRDISRVDIIVEGGGSANFLEATTSPGLTETSILNLAIAETGSTVGQLYSDLMTRVILRAAHN